MYQKDWEKGAKPSYFDTSIAWKNVYLFKGEVKYEVLIFY